MLYKKCNLCVYHQSQTLTCSREFYVNENDELIFHTVVFCRSINGDCGPSAKNYLYDIKLDEDQFGLFIVPY